MKDNMITLDAEYKNLAILEFALKLSNHQNHSGEDFWKIVNEVQNFVRDGEDEG